MTETKDGNRESPCLSSGIGRYGALDRPSELLNTVSHQNVEHRTSPKRVDAPSRQTNALERVTHPRLSKCRRFLCRRPLSPARRPCPPRRAGRRRSCAPRRRISPRYEPSAHFCSLRRIPIPADARSARCSLLVAAGPLPSRHRIRGGITADRRGRRDVDRIPSRIRDRA